MAWEYGPTAPGASWVLTTCRELAEMLITRRMADDLTRLEGKRRDRGTEEEDLDPANCTRATERQGLWTAVLQIIVLRGENEVGIGNAGVVCMVGKWP